MNRAEAECDSLRQQLSRAQAQAAAQRGPSTSGGGAQSSDELLKKVRADLGLVSYCLHLLSLSRCGLLCPQVIVCVCVCVTHCSSFLTLSLIQDMELHEVKLQRDLLFVCALNASPLLKQCTQDMELHEVKLQRDQAQVQARRMKDRLTELFGEAGERSDRVCSLIWRVSCFNNRHTTSL